MCICLTALQMNEIAVNFTDFYLLTFTYCTYFYLNFAPRFEKTD